MYNPTCPSLKNLVIYANQLSLSYNMLLSEKCDAVHKLWCKTQKRWSFSYERYVYAFKAIMQVTNVTKYRDFQYRLLNKIVFMLITDCFIGRKLTPNNVTGAKTLNKRLNICCTTAKKLSHSGTHLKSSC